MAFKRSAVRSRLSPPRPEIFGFQVFFFLRIAKEEGGFAALFLCFHVYLVRLRSSNQKLIQSLNIRRVNAAAVDIGQLQCIIVNQRINTTYMLI